MRRRNFTVAVVLTLASSLTMTSCIGSFSLFNSVLKWNQHVDNKFVNELVFIAFWILPVYEVAALADLVVINSIEFWSGSNPVACGRTVIEGQDGRYLVDCDGKGYTITSENDGSVVRLDFDDNDRSWSATINDVTYPLMTFVDDNHVRMATPDGSSTIVELSQYGVTAYQQLATTNVLMAAR